MQTIVISKEDAVFWMDGNGRWHNQHGEFEHKKVIDYFNRSLGYDDDGYYVSQERGEIHEKVYFPYQETALFVVDIVSNGDIALVLNTGEQMALSPDKLVVDDDSLFIRKDDEIAKFNDRSMIKMSHWFEEIDGQFHICLNGKHHPIQTLENQ